MKNLILLLAIVGACFPALAQKKRTDITGKYSKTPTGYMMVLVQGDTVLAAIEQLAVKENIPSATFSAIGFVSAEFGFYNRVTKSYDPKRFNNMELASMTGSIAWEGSRPSLHAHGVVTDENFRTYGGHVLMAIVGTGSVEITIVLHDKKMYRRKDPALDANVLEVPK